MEPWFIKAFTNGLKKEKVTPDELLIIFKKYKSLLSCSERKSHLLFNKLIRFLLPLEKQWCDAIKKLEDPAGKSFKVYFKEEFGNSAAQVSEKFSQPAVASGGATSTPVIFATPAPATSSATHNFVPGLKPEQDPESESVYTECTIC